MKGLMQFSSSSLSFPLSPNIYLSSLFPVILNLSHSHPEKCVLKNPAKSSIHFSNGGQKCTAIQFCIYGSFFLITAIEQTITRNEFTAVELYIVTFVL
jgi:hypothetical protein